MPEPEPALMGILGALERDLSKGLLATFEELVHASVYSDLLEQATGLQRDGYSRAATVVAGAALEEHIKKLAVKHSIDLVTPNKDHKRASILNSELKKAGLYSEAQRAVVEGWQKVRNDAAHGNPGFEGADKGHVQSVSPMITSIRGFIVQYPA
jgi:hypothetical protein